MHLKNYKKAISKKFDTLDFECFDDETEYYGFWVTITSINL